MKTATNHTTTPEPHVLQRRIGSTNYKVGIHFSHDAEETLDKKILRLLKNDLQSPPQDATMETLQAGRLSERGSA